jgi:hypothetical protein
MKKICLDLDALVVETFNVEMPEPPIRGTVQGRDGAISEVRHCNSEEGYVTCPFSCRC